MQRVTSIPGISISAWPDEESAVIFVPNTASTHLVSALAGDILAAAEKGPFSVPELALALGIVVSGDEDSAAGSGHDDAVDLAKAVRGLLQAGLLQSVK